KMTPITAPVIRNSPRDSIANLQDALLALLPSLPISDNDRAALDQRIRTERAQGAYLDATAKLVGMFQERNHLAVTGNVDEQTAAMLNGLLRQQGLLGGDGAEVRRCVVSGTVLREDGTPIAQVEVRAFHQARSSVRLGVDTTDAQGRYTIPYEAASAL